MDRNELNAMLDSMTGKWAELRDMGRDNPAARMVMDSILANKAGRAIESVPTEQILLHAVVALIHENAALQKSVLRFAMEAPMPFLFGGIDAKNPSPALDGSTG